MILQRFMAYDKKIDKFLPLNDNRINFRQAERPLSACLFMGLSMRQQRDLLDGLLDINLIRQENILWLQSRWFQL